MSRSAAAGAYFDYLVFIIMENRNLCHIFVACGGSATYMSSLANDYGIATDDRFCSVHPSLPNYLCLSGASDFGCSGYDGSPNSNTCTTAAWGSPNIADKLESAGLSWKAYMEDMPSPCYGSDSGLYIVHHDPFMYYSGIATNAARCARVVPSGANGSVLVSDLGSTSTASNFMWFTPNNCHNMHSCSVSAGDNFLSTVVPQILGSTVFKNSRAALLITFDEDERAGQPVYTAWAGPSVKRGFQSTFGYDHFSVLATIESNWNLAPLAANDRDAPNMAEFFTGQPARAASPAPSPLSVGFFILILAPIVGAAGILVAIVLVLRSRKRRRPQGPRLR